MLTAKGIVDRILEEELDFLADGKRAIVSDRIIKELHLQNVALLDVNSFPDPSKESEKVAGSFNGQVAGTGRKSQILERRMPNTKRNDS